MGSAMGSLCVGLSGSPRGKGKGKSPSHHYSCSDHTLWLRSDSIYALSTEHRALSCRRAYPHMLLTGSLNDPRVGYWQPAKFTAKMRANKLGNRLLLLKVWTIRVPHRSTLFA